MGENLNAKNRPGSGRYSARGKGRPSSNRYPSSVNDSYGGPLYGAMNYDSWIDNFYRNPEWQARARREGWRDGETPSRFLYCFFCCAIASCCMGCTKCGCDSNPHETRGGGPGAGIGGMGKPYGNKRLTQKDTIEIYNRDPQLQAEARKFSKAGPGGGAHDLTGWFWCMVCCLLSSCCDGCSLCDRDCMDEW